MINFSADIGNIIDLYKRNPEICLRSVKTIGLNSFIKQADEAGFNYSAYVQIIGAYKMNETRGIV